MPINPDMEQGLRDAFRAKKTIFQSLTREIELTLRNAIQAAGLIVYQIEARTKEEDSFIKKCGRKRYTDPLTQSTDVSGCRVVSNYRIDIDAIEQVIRGAFVIDEVNSARHDQPSDPTAFGYSSRHFVVTLKEPSNIYLAGHKAEIQVRSALQHIWAAIEHSLQYKKELDRPEIFTRRFARVAAMLDLVDDEFDSLRAEATQALMKVVGDPQIQEAEFEEDRIGAPSSREALPRYLMSVGLQDALIIKDIVSEFGPKSIGSKEWLSSYIQTQKQIVIQNRLEIDDAETELNRISAEVQRVKDRGELDVRRIRLLADLDAVGARIEIGSQAIKGAHAKLSAIDALHKHVTRPQSPLQGSDP
ncbi:hypothetical protein [uncultured Amaricoccus sp.]|uniref:GTP pyrophosphokinase n=1 Tax=uncultured Amaricoccus sp. TaxID=339341 RepID=UPI002613EE9E|nr:hypothetical protein [uncultured Amaricoccus sp.]